jgi:hypothetical protein
MPVYVHNLKSYDAHFLILAMTKYGYQAEGNIDNISCIPNNEEKFISFSKSVKVGEYTDKKTKKVKSIMYEIRFLDSLAFMATSLEKLTSNLKSNCNTTPELREIFKHTSQHYKNDDEFVLMTEKGIYPYEYITDYNVLSETTLPSIDKFYSKLNDTSCSIIDYEKAQKVWTTFNCQTLKDYHNLYLTADVLLLSDIWENFRTVCYKIYNLDACYYYTAPSLSWDAWLYHSNLESKKNNGKKFEIELITDIDMYLFVEQNIRGGLSQISKRYAKANNKYMKNYDMNKIDEYILYLDANNLYGYGMSQYLPQGGFKWNTKTWSDKKILNIPDDAKVGYMFEVDLHYPEELHNLHNGYALAPVNMDIKNSQLNDWQQEDRKENKITKLCTSFEDKIKYGVNYRLLKLYIQLGVKVTKIHRVLQFKQSDYMKSYIMKNTNERAQAKNDFEKDFYKLMNNSVYGKTMENVRGRINFKFVSTEQQALNIRNRRTRHTIFNEDLVGVHLLKKEVKLNKPIFIGQCVLDNSKYLMYDFHYNFMLKNFKRENIDLLFTDTDSLCYHIKNQNPYELMGKNKEYFDLSDYAKDHELHDNTNKKVIGKFKDECSGKQIIEFVGLRSKLYSYLTDEDKKFDHKKCKGCKKGVVDKVLSFQNYKNTLFERTPENIKQNVFRSYKHKIYTEEVTKVALSCFDDKCYIQDDNINTYTFGHKNIV